MQIRLDDLKGITRRTISASILLVVLLITAGPAHALVFEWATETSSSAGSANAFDVCSDLDANTYVVGQFRGTVDFDPGPATFNMTSPNGQFGAMDAFVLKLDSAGNFIWAKKIGGSSTTHDYAGGVAVDLSGNVYLVGQFGGTVDFDPGPATFNMTASGTADAFVSKLDNAGNFIWAKRTGGSIVSSSLSWTDVPRDVAVDAGGNVLIVGSFYGTSDFDPGPGTFNLTTSGVSDAFVWKLNSAGNFVWAKQMNGADSAWPYQVAVDGSGNVITVGGFGSTIDFDPGPGTFNLSSPGGSEDAFVWKLNSAGNFVWAKQLGGPSTDRALGVTVDSNGTIYTVGKFYGTADFDPGPGVNNLTTGGSDQEVFVSKLDQNGAFVWARLLGGTTNAYLDGPRVALDGSGNVLTTGGFSNTVDMDPGPGTFLLTENDNTNAFISKLDAAGSFVWGDNWVAERATPRHLACTSMLTVT